MFDFFSKTLKDQGAKNPSLDAAKQQFRKVVFFTYYSEIIFCSNHRKS